MLCTVPVQAHKIKINLKIIVKAEHIKEPCKATTPPPSPVMRSNGRNVPAGAGLTLKLLKVVSTQATKDQKHAALRKEKNKPPTTLTDSFFNSNGRTSWHRQHLQPFACSSIIFSPSIHTNFGCFITEIFARLCTVGQAVHAWKIAFKSRISLVVTPKFWITN